MFTRNAYFQYSHRAVSVITAFTLVFSTFVFALPNLASAATTLFEDDFESNDFTAWTYNDNKWTVDANNPSPHTGAYRAEVNGNTSSTEELRKNLSTEGYENITVNYWYHADSLEDEDGDGVQVQWFDGVDWNTIFTIDEDVAIDSWVFRSDSLPAGAADNPDFQLRFEADLDQGNDSVAIDDVSVTADAMPEPDTTTIIVSDDTAAGENQPGWMFNRDTSTDTPFYFTSTEASIGSGSLYVSPITNTEDGNNDKFISELFLTNRYHGHRQYFV